MKRTAIRNGRVIDPANALDANLDVFIANGNIVGVGKAPEGFSADQEIDARNHLVLPGLVDLCVRMREPGMEHKATIASETAAAASGGITSVCVPPDTDPVIDTPAVAELIRRKAKQAGNARVYCLGALTQDLHGERLSEMAALQQAGCLGVSNVRAIADSKIQRLALEYAATHNMTVYLIPEDPYLSKNGCAHEGHIASRLGLPGIPACAETAAVARDLALVEETGGRVHFTRLSTRRAVRMIARARFDGLPVSADVCAHQLFLTDNDIGEFNSVYHVRPPLRSEQDRIGLRQGILEKVIEAICSDHQPHEADAKEAPFCSTRPGVSAVETLLPLTLRLVDELQLNLLDGIRLVTQGPAKILGINAGTLSVGARADICIVDPDRTWVLRAEEMRSEGRNSPFIGQSFRGKVTHTLLEGKLVFRE